MTGLQEIKEGLLWDSTIDGKTLLYSWDEGIKDNNPNDEMAPLRKLYKSNSDGSNAVKLGEDKEYHLGFAKFSNDNKKIAYLENSEESFSAYIMNSDGSGKRKISGDGSIVQSFISWSPNGNYVIFAESQPQNKIVIANRDGDIVKEIKSNSKDMTLSHPEFYDNNKIVFIGIRESDGLTTLMWLDKNNPEKLTKITNAYNYEISPNKKYLVYSYNVGESDGTKTKVAAINKDMIIGNILDVTKKDDRATSYAWSNDSKYLAYTTDNEVWAYSIDNKQIKKLVGDMANIKMFLVWKGKNIYFTLFKPDLNKNYIYKIDLK